MSDDLVLENVKAASSGVVDTTLKLASQAAKQSSRAAQHANQDATAAYRDGVEQLSQASRGSLFAAAAIGFVLGTILLRVR